MSSLSRSGRDGVIKHFVRVHLTFGSLGRGLPAPLSQPLRIILIAFE